MDQPGHGPTVARLRLGVLLRAGRGAAGITGRQAAERIGSSTSKISRVESGLLPVRVGDVTALLDLYDISDPGQRELGLALADESTREGWWDPFSGDLPTSMVHILNVEAAATRIVVYDAHAVPALLQTHAYSRAISSAPSPGAPRTWRGGLGLETLARRKQILHLPTAPHVWAIIDEAVLHRFPARSPDVLAGQIAHLIEVAEGGGVAIQIVPRGDPATLAVPGPYSILRFLAARELPDVVMLEQLTTFTTLGRRQDLDVYWRLTNLLAIQARSPVESLEMLRQLLAQLRPGEQPAGSSQSDI